MRWISWRAVWTYFVECACMVCMYALTYDAFVLENEAWNILLAWYKAYIPDIAKMQQNVKNQNILENKVSLLSMVLPPTQKKAQCGNERLSLQAGRRTFWAVVLEKRQGKSSTVSWAEWQEAARVLLGREAKHTMHPLRAGMWTYLACTANSLTSATSLEALSCARMMLSSTCCSSAVTCWQGAGTNQPKIVTSPHECISRQDTRLTW
jgi:hypothetical protein